MKPLIFIFIALAAFDGQDMVAAQNIQDCPDPVTLSCLKKNFSTFYRKDYKHFFSTFNRFEAEAMSCKSNVKTADFLDIVSYIKGNAEVAEAFGESSEKLLVRNPKCFLDAASTLDDSSLKILVQLYLKGPIIEDYQAIDKKMREQKKNQKYHRIMSEYFRE